MHNSVILNHFGTLVSKRYILKIQLYFILLYRKCFNISVDQYLLLNKVFFFFKLFMTEYVAVYHLNTKIFFPSPFSTGIPNDGLILVLKKALQYTAVAACQKLLLLALNFSHRSHNKIWRVKSSFSNSIATKEEFE